MTMYIEDVIELLELLDESVEIIKYPTEDDPNMVYKVLDKEKFERANKIKKELRKVDISRLKWRDPNNEANKRRLAKLYQPKQNFN